VNDFRDLALFAWVMAVGQFSPGPDMILLTRTALAEGVKAGAIMAFGIATGLVIHTAIAVAGLAVAFQKSPRLHLIISWLAAAYLTWLAWKLLRGALARPAPASAAAEVKGEPPVLPSTRRPYLRGLLCNLLNPKVVIFLAAICADFLDPGRPGWFPYALVAVVVVQGGLLWALWAWLLQWAPLRYRYERSARWIDGVFGVLLVLLSVKLVVGG
jgi:threonine efflux protein